MNLLTSVGRSLVVVGAAVMVLMCVVAGAGVLSHLVGWLVGAVVGGLVGLVLAGSVFGALAAIFEIARHTEKTAILLERAEKARGG